MTTKPDFILYAQHGWADTKRQIAKLAQGLATSQTLIIAPSLGWVKTWVRITPLIEAVEKIATENIAQYPDVPLRIIGHSMGGLIWLEVLHRHPEWWTKVHSLVLIGSPVGGSHLGRIIDNFATGIGMAQDLGVNRRPLAEAIAAIIPTLTIAGDLDHGTDGTVNIEATKFQYAQFVCLPKLHHAVMKNHPEVATVIRNFWENPQVFLELSNDDDFGLKLIQFLRSLPSLIDGHPRDFKKAQIYLTLQNEYTLRLWRNPLQIEHIFIGDRHGKCIYSGFVLWKDIPAFHQFLEQIKQNFT